MEFEKMIELIKTVSDSNLTQFQIEEAGFKLSMKTDKQSKVVVQKQESLYAGVQPSPAAAYHRAHAGWCADGADR